MSEEIKESTDGTLEQGDFKMKKKPGRPRKLNKDKETVKVDMSKKEEVKKEEPTKLVIEEKEEPVVEETKEVVNEEVKEEIKEEESTPVIQEITDEPVKEEVVVNETIATPEETVEAKLPENIEKLVSFMEETGGTVEDYVRLNADYSNIDESTLLREYYKRTKPHLDSSEIDFILEDKFYYDEEVEEEREIRKKKLAYKEEIAEARNFLEETKKKYYDEIKLRPGVTQEQQKAMDFFNRYNKEQEIAKQQHEAFKAKTKDYFSNDFKGFDFSVGEKRFRYGVNNANDVAEAQSDLTTFFKKFLNEDGSVKDQSAYHKAIYAARNADTIANHFYEQGKADATKDIMAKSKNISKDARTEIPGDIYINGMKVKAITGVNSSKLKVKTIKK